MQRKSGFIPMTLARDSYGVTGTNIVQDARNIGNFWLRAAAAIEASSSQHLWNQKVNPMQF